MVGDDRTSPKQDLPLSVRQSGLEGSVSFRSYVSESELSELYQRATVFAFLSEYEGFGLPPLEAMSAGVPVVVAINRFKDDSDAEVELLKPVFLFWVLKYG